jgi:4-carboxymuconolactone decarboxylase
VTQDRLPPISPSLWTPAQRGCADEIIQGPRGALIEPFIPLLRSPELCTHAQRMGEYLRYRSALGLRLSELAILVTARHWSQEVEWAIHAPIAIREGIDACVVEAIGLGQPPAFSRADDQAVFEVSMQSLVDKQVDDATWAAAVAQLGEQGTVDLLGIVGYYTMLSVVMNGARTPAPLQSVMRLPALAGPGA